MTGETKELLEARDLCPRLGLSSGRVYQLIAEGVIPHVKVGNSIRIPRQAWESWLATQNRAAEMSVDAPRAGRAGVGATPPTTSEA